MKIPKRTIERIKDGFKKYQKVAINLRERDVSEADTVTVVKDMLAEVFGYDKYLELTGEQQIRGTFCDLAVKIDGKIKYLIEVKAAGVDLNDAHLRQAIDYGAKEGIEWVVLTNALSWNLHRIKFGKPIEHEEVASFNMADINLRRDDDQRKVYLLSREAIGQGAMATYHQQTQIFNRYTIAQLLSDDAVLATVRRLFRKLYPDIKIDKEDIADLLVEEVLKRDVVESDKAKEAATMIKRTGNKIAKKEAKAKEKAELDSQTQEPPTHQAPTLQPPAQDPPSFG